MRNVLVCLVLLTIGCMVGAEVEEAPLPEDPFQRVAVRALRGEWGELAEWQRLGYERIAAGEGQQMRLWVTFYWPKSPNCSGGSRTASGMPVNRRIAAMLDRRNPWGDWVLVALPEGMQLRQVYDTGSRANHARAVRQGADTWVDLWEPRRRMQSFVRPALVVSR